jgi:cbb3-type cytochrome oxidase maturation protein
MGLEALYLLIPVSVLLAAVSLALFVWAMLTGQFDDLETPALRVLFDEDAPVAGAPSASADQDGERAAPSGAADEALSVVPPPRRQGN